MIVWYGWFVFFKQKTADEMRISDWSSDVCSSDLCSYRLERAKGEPRFAGREQIAQFQRIVAGSGRTRMGDLAELEGLPDDSPLLPMVTSTAENCLGSECLFWNECFVVQARQRAQNADVVVVNHHLLLVDLALKQEGFGDNLPRAQGLGGGACRERGCQRVWI